MTIAQQLTLAALFPSILCLVFFVGWFYEATANDKLKKKMRQAPAALSDQAKIRELEKQNNAMQRELEWLRPEHKKDVLKTLELEDRCEQLQAEREELLKSLELFTLLNPNHYSDIAGMIGKAVEVVNKVKGGQP